MSSVLLNRTIEGPSSEFQPPLLVALLSVSLSALSRNQCLSEATETENITININNSYIP